MSVTRMFEGYSSTQSVLHLLGLALFLLQIETSTPFNWYGSVPCYLTWPSSASPGTTRRGTHWSRSGIHLQYSRQLGDWAIGHRKPVGLDRTRYQTLVQNIVANLQQRYGTLRRNSLRWEVVWQHAEGGNNHTAVVEHPSGQRALHVIEMFWIQWSSIILAPWWI